MYASLTNAVAAINSNLYLLNTPFRRAEAVNLHYQLICMKQRDALRENYDTIRHFADI